MCHGPCVLLPVIFQISFGKAVTVLPRTRKMFFPSKETIHITSNKKKNSGYLAYCVLGTHILPQAQSYEVMYYYCLYFL